MLSLFGATLIALGLGYAGLLGACAVGYRRALRKATQRRSDQRPATGQDHVTGGHGGLEATPPDPISGGRWQGSQMERATRHGDDLPFVSVIVAARNEEATIERCLNSILEVDYQPDRLEIVIVDDHSEDRTAAIVEGVKASLDNEVGRERPRVRLIRLGVDEADEADGTGRKKQALQAGIDRSVGSVLLLTDADCEVGVDWVWILTSTLVDDVGFVSARVGFSSTGRFLDHLQAVEFAGLVAIGGGSIEMGWPLLCNGANLGYRRAAFEAAGGFEDIDHLTSGDDELLMWKVHQGTPFKVAFSGDPRAATSTLPAPSVVAFLEQRARWASKGRHYPSRAKRVLVLMIFGYLLVLAVSPLVLLAAPTLLPAIAAAWLLKLGADSVVLLTASPLSPGRTLAITLVGEVLHAPYIVGVAITGALKGYAWKGRQTNR